MSSAGRRVLVTGGSGFLGSNFARVLVDRGYAVRVLDNNFRGSRDKLGPCLSRLEFVEGDVRDPGTVRAAVRGVEIVCHLAFINGTRYFYERPRDVLDVGVRGTLNVLEASVDSGVSEFLFVSSSEVYQTPPIVPTPETVPLSIPDPRNPRYSYGGGKLIGEILTCNYGRGKFARTLIARPHNVYGPDMGFEHVIPEFVVRLRRAASRQPTGVLEFPIQGAGTETRAFCDVRDFTDGLVLVLERGGDGEIYHVGTDEEVSVAQLASRIAALMGREIRLVATPLRAGGTPRRCPDITRLRALGYSPRFRLDDGLAASIAWYAGWADAHPETAAARV